MTRKDVIVIWTSIVGYIPNEKIIERFEDSSIQEIVSHMVANKLKPLQTVDITKNEKNIKRLIDMKYFRFLRYNSTTNNHDMVDCGKGVIPWVVKYTIGVPVSDRNYVVDVLQSLCRATHHTRDPIKKKLTLVLSLEPTVNHNVILKYLPPINCIVVKQISKLGKDKNAFFVNEYCHCLNNELHMYLEDDVTVSKQIFNIMDIIHSHNILSPQRYSLYDLNNHEVDDPPEEVGLTFVESYSVVPMAFILFPENWELLRRCWFLNYSRDTVKGYSWKQTIKEYVNVVACLRLNVSLVRHIGEISTSKRILRLNDNGNYFNV